MKSMPVPSLRVRLIVLFIAIFGSTLVLFSAILYQFFVRNHETEFDSALYNHAVDIARSVDFGIFGELTVSRKVLTENEKIFPFALGESFVQIRTPQGFPVAQSSNLGDAAIPLTEEERREVLLKRVSFKTMRARQMGIRKRGEYRILTHLIERPGPDFLLQVAAPMTLLSKERNVLLTFFLLSVPAVLIIAAWGGWYLSKKALAPIGDIIAKTKRITALQLSERVPVPSSSDEIRELASTLNDLLNRLERAFRSQESFIADASHQLKTPLAILRGEIDLMKARPRTSEEVGAFLESASQEMSYLTRMVEDLITLARIDAGEGALSVDAYRVDEVVIETVSRLEQLAAARGIRISLNLEPSDAVQTPFEIVGDRDLIRSVFESIVENAIKYSPDQSVVTVSLEESPEEARLVVQDEGSGITPESLTKIYDRFYRSETTRDFRSGSGLGLAIAKKIVDLHQGRIHAENASGRGARFTVTLPRKLK